MKVIHGLHKIKKLKKPVVALGVFDGVHCGHINILKDAARFAHSVNGTSVVLTFDPHPQKEDSLTSLAHRLRLIAQQGIDAVAVVNFNTHFKNMRAVDFVRGVLAKKLGAYAVYVGDNFRFGKNAEGNVETLKAFSREYHFKIKVFKCVRVNRHPISSTSIRSLIKQGKLELAGKLLCRPVTVLGSVIRGTKVGRRLGFPTANIDPHHEVMPPQGAYAVRVIMGKKKLLGVCNIGRRPTFYKQGVIHIEVYIFNFNRNIYGKYLEIQFVKKIRNEKKFPSAALLIDQIRKDITFAKNFFSPH